MKFLIDLRAARDLSDAAIVGDAGSPLVLRFGEKGFLWIEIEATGLARLARRARAFRGERHRSVARGALDALAGPSRALPPDAPDSVSSAIAAPPALRIPGSCAALENPACCRRSP